MSNHQTQERQQQQTNGNNNRGNRGLTSTTVPLEPVGVAYNIDNETIQQFVENYLTSAKKINGVMACRLVVNREETALYVFFEMNSKDIITGLEKVPEHLRARMEIDGLRASDELWDALRPLTDKNAKLSARVQGKTKAAYIKLNIFRVLGMILDADRNRHQIVVTEVRALKKSRSVMTVFKSNRFIDSSDRDEDMFSAWAQDLED